MEVPSPEQNSKTAGSESAVLEELGGSPEKGVALMAHLTTTSAGLSRKKRCFRKHVRHKPQESRRSTLKKLKMIGN
jgi:hypothetical protein